MASCRTLRSAAEAVLVIRTDDVQLQASLEKYCESEVRLAMETSLTIDGLTADEMSPFMSTARVLVNPAQTPPSEWSYEASIDVTAGTFRLFPTLRHRLIMSSSVRRPERKDSSNRQAQHRTKQGPQMPAMLDSYRAPRERALHPMWRRCEPLKHMHMVFPLHPTPNAHRHPPP